MTINELQQMQNLNEQQKMYVLTSQKGKKDIGLAYLCWLLFGVHYFYLNRPLTNIIYWLTLGGFGLWTLIDLFRIPSMVRKNNEEATQEAIHEAVTILNK